MTNTNITNFRKNLFEYMNQAVEYSDVINVSTKNGNAVIMSEDDYNGLMETLYLKSIPGMTEKLTEGMKTPLADCVPEEDVNW